MLKMAQSRLLLQERKTAMNVTDCYNASPLSVTVSLQKHMKILTSGMHCNDSLIKGKTQDRCSPGISPSLLWQVLRTVIIWPQTSSNDWHKINRSPANCCCETSHGLWRKEIFANWTANKICCNQRARLHTTKEKEIRP